jgi:hypothetical protein
LPALKAEEYIDSENPLGLALAALMKAPADDKLQLALRGLRRLVNYPVDAWRKFLLGDCLIAYSASDAEQKDRLSELLDKDENREVRAMTTTWYDEALEKGERKVILNQLRARFNVTEDVRAALDAWPAERLEELSLALLSAKSLKELGLEP